MDAPLRSEALRRPDQPYMALADEVFQGQAAAAVLLGHQDHEAQVRLDQAPPGLRVPLRRQPGAGLFFLCAQPRDLAELPQVETHRALLAAHALYIGPSVLRTHRTFVGWGCDA